MKKIVIICHDRYAKRILNMADHDLVYFSDVTSVSNELVLDLPYNGREPEKDKQIKLELEG